MTRVLLERVKLSEMKLVMLRGPYFVDHYVLLLTTTIMKIEKQVRHLEYDVQQIGKAYVS